MAVSDLKPRTVGELLDAAFYVYRGQFVRLVTVALVVSFPALVVAAIYSKDAGTAAAEVWENVVRNSRTQHESPLQAFTSGLTVMEPLNPFLYLQAVLQATARSAGIVTMAIAARSALARETAPPLRVLLTEALPRLPGAFLVQLVSDLLLVNCIACCPPIGIILMVLIACTSAAIALERGPLETSLRAAWPAWIRWTALPFVTAIDGLVRSVSLSWSARTIGRGTSYLFFVFMFVSIADGAAATLGIVFAGRAGGWYWAQHCAEALILPAWGLAIAFWFADLRTRREGIDLVMAA